MPKLCFLAEEYGRENWKYPTVNISHTIRGTFHAQYLSGLADDVYYGAEWTVSMVYGDSLYEAVRAHTHNVPARMHDHSISLSLQFILSESFVPFHFICAGIPRFHTTPCQMGEWRQYLFWNMVFKRFQLEE